MADLVVKGDVLFRSVDVDVIPQTIEELRPVSLRINRLEDDALDIVAALRPSGLGGDVAAAGRFPRSGEASQRTEVRQRVRIDGRGLGEYVGGEIRHHLWAPWCRSKRA